MKICLIFDVDDTLIKYENFNFEEWYRFVTEPVARRLKIPMDVEIWRNIMDGKISRRYPEKFGIDAVEFWKMVDDRNLEYRKMMFSAGRLGIYEDVYTIKSLPGIKIAWSASSSRCIRFVLEKNSLLELFDIIVGKDYGNYGYIDEIKPRSGLLKKIINRMKCDKCYVVGDSKRDMVAAGDAGCMAVFLSRDGGENYGDISIKSLKELKDLING